MLIKNYSFLAKTTERKILLDILNYGLENLDYHQEILKLGLFEGQIKTKQQIYELKNFSRIYLLGFGKGSSYLGKEIYQYLSSYFNFKKCFLIDFRYDDLELPSDEKFIFFEGTHPLVSQQNVQATLTIVDFFLKENLTLKDLIIVIICGGGSAMFSLPAKISLEEKINLTKKLLLSGASIEEINTVRKHLSLVKGGGLAKILFPAQVISLIVSDVPGDKIECIASGPTTLDKTTVDDAWQICQKYNLSLDKEKFIETPKEMKYFLSVDNFILFSNRKILKSMADYALSFDLKPIIIKDDINFSTQEFVETLKIDLNTYKDNDLFLYGGETTVKISHPGKGGRNQDLVLRFLNQLRQQKFNSLFKLTLIAFNSDGWDNTEFGGAIGDELTLIKADELNLDIPKAIEENKSFEFFSKTGDGIITGRLPINVSDFILLLKSK